jgi:hypothetical protein
MSTGSHNKKKRVRQDRTSEPNTQAQPTQDDETRRSTMPEIRDIYDPSEGADERNEWQSTLYNTLRRKLNLEEILPCEARELATKLDHHQRDHVTTHTAHAFLAAHGWLLSEGFAREEELSEDDLGREFLKGYSPKWQRVASAVISWAQQSGHDIWSWRLYRVVSKALDLDSPDQSFDQYWPDVSETGLDGLPVGFPSERRERVSLAETGATALGTQPQGAYVQGQVFAPEAKLRFPELFVHPSDGNTPDEQSEIVRANKKRQRFYRAVRYLLSRDFGVTGLPLTAEGFATFAKVGHNGAISPPAALRMIGVMGNVLKNNSGGDPLFGRPADTRWNDDIVTRDDGPPVRIAKRFADSVVAAMQEYTSRADLYAETQKLLAREGHRANGHTHAGLG